MLSVTMLSVMVPKISFQIVLLQVFQQLSYKKMQMPLG
jgi:hypothetical protein